MEISVEELNELLQKEFERGRNSIITGSYNIVDITNPINQQFYIPDACKTCSKHPSNGGDGICNCTLGTIPVKYSCNNNFENIDTTNVNAHC